MSENYYNSDTWQAIKEKRLIWDRYTCQDCGATADDGVELNVHHLNYDTFGGEEDYKTDLITLCKNCHAARHNKKRNPFVISLDDEMPEIPPDGEYVCRILSVKYDEEKQCIKAHLDIAEGEYADFGLEASKALHKRIAYPMISLSSKTSGALYHAKRNISQIAKDNPDVPVIEEINAGNYSILTNCRIGCKLRINPKWEGRSDVNNMVWSFGEIVPLENAKKNNFILPF